MTQKLSTLTAPAVAGVVRETSVRAAIAEIKNCIYDGATMIDLHMSCLANSDVESLRKIISASRLPILALNYNNTFTMGKAGLTEEERVDSFRRAIEAGAAGIDMQGYTFHLPSKSGFCGEDKYSFTKGNPKEVVTDEKVISKQCELIELAHANGTEVLLSCHPGIPMKAEQVVDLALFLEQRNPDIIKIVTKARDEDDLAESIRTMLLLKKEIKTPIAYHANGSAGMLSRIINPILGGQIAFCVDHYNAGSTMEQIDLKTAVAAIESVQKIARS
ncbi:MAG: type I 3-dehydroquinate dehydratase [Clostridia bacterium]|nr:type I 3-dehydroquinate dehydratase [Clostridia bacterium]